MNANKIDKYPTPVIILYVAQMLALYTDRSGDRDVR